MWLQGVSFFVLKYGFFSFGQWCITVEVVKELLWVKLWKNQNNCNFSIWLFFLSLFVLVNWNGVLLNGQSVRICLLWRWNFHIVEFQAVKVLAKSPTFARNPRQMQFEADMNRLFLFTWLVLLVFPPSHYEIESNSTQKSTLWWWLLLTYEDNLS